MNKTAWMQLILPWHLARQGVGVAHFTNSVAPAWTPCPTVVTLHDLTLWLHPEFHYWRRVLSMRPLIGPAVRRAQAVIAVSHSTAQDAMRLLGLQADKVRVIPEAADPSFEPLAREEARARAAGLGLPERYLLNVGTLEPRKNLVRLLEAFAHLRRRHGDLALVLTGQRGWKERSILETVERLGLSRAVRMTGRVPRAALVGVYGAAEALVYPSLYEGFGLPLIEAMACGTPVIAAPNGALRETGGDAVEFVDPLHVDSIVAGVEKVLNDPAWAAELRKRGLARAAHWTWADAARETRAVYAQVSG
jgi:glycosyltransferase involved in cell wall biosynthesis